MATIVTANAVNPDLSPISIRLDEESERKDYDAQYLFNELSDEKE